MIFHKYHGSWYFLVKYRLWCKYNSIFKQKYLSVRFNDVLFFWIWVICYEKDLRDNDKIGAFLAITFYYDETISQLFLVLRRCSFFGGSFFFSLFKMTMAPALIAAVSGSGGRSIWLRHLWKFRKSYFFFFIDTDVFILVK